MYIVLSYYVINGTQRKFEWRYLALCIVKKCVRVSAKFEAYRILLRPNPLYTIFDKIPLIGYIGYRYIHDVRCNQGPLF